MISLSPNRQAQRTRETPELCLSEDFASFGGVVVTSRMVKPRAMVYPSKKVQESLGSFISLIRNADPVVTRGELIRHGCWYSVELRSRSIETQIFNLRHKLEKDPTNPTHILTVQNVGYRFKKP
jgi:DNA-binding response OmpR family regulator